MSGRSHFQQRAGAPGSCTAQPSGEGEETDEVGNLWAVSICTPIIMPSASLRLSLPSAECKAGFQESSPRTLRRMWAGCICKKRNLGPVRGRRVSERRQSGGSSFSSSTWQWRGPRNLPPTWQPVEAATVTFQRDLINLIVLCTWRCLGVEKNVKCVTYTQQQQRETHMKAKICVAIF